MRIGTIHAFCQSLLRRFPLEAAVSPHFRLSRRPTPRGARPRRERSSPPAPAARGRWRGAGRSAPPTRSALVRRCRRRRRAGRPALLLPDPAALEAAAPRRRRRRGATRRPAPRRDPAAGRAAMRRLLAWRCGPGRPACRARRPDARLARSGASRPPRRLGGLARPVPDRRRRAARAGGFVRGKARRRPARDRRCAAGRGRARGGGRRCLPGDPHGRATMALLRLAGPVLRPLRRRQAGARPARLRRPDRPHADAAARSGRGLGALQARWRHRPPAARRGAGHLRRCSGASPARSPRSSSPAAASRWPADRACCRAPCSRSATTSSRSTRSRAPTRRRSTTGREIFRERVETGGQVWREPDARPCRSARSCRCWRWSMRCSRVRRRRAAWSNPAARPGPARLGPAGGARLRRAVAAGAACRARPDRRTRRRRPRRRSLVGARAQPRPGLRPAAPGRRAGALDRRRDRRAVTRAAPLLGRRRRAGAGARAAARSSARWCGR